MATKRQVTPNLKALAPSTENTVSAVLNGISNALMVVGAGLLLTPEETRKNNSKLIYASSAISIVLGAVWGWREAKQMNAYREAVLDEVEDLRKNVETLKAENAGWKEKVTAAAVTQASAQRGA